MTSSNNSGFKLKDFILVARIFGFLAFIVLMMLIFSIDTLSGILAALTISTIIFFGWIAYASIKKAEEMFGGTRDQLFNKIYNVFNPDNLLG